MTILNFISMGGGVALFLYGMSVMGNGLEKLAGGRMEKALERLTNNIFLSVLLGAVVTATIQSSSATTVIVVGLVNAGVMKLRQAVGVIMGANIGTTVTAQIIRLSDIQSDSLMMQLFKPSTLAPLAATVGILLYMAAKGVKKRELGQMLVGFGILFSGMFAMEAAVRPLQVSESLPHIMTAMSHIPVLGVLAGALVTAAIQSSSASVGILQAIASTGVISCSTAFPIIMGQNIGTCITPILASIGASKNAKRSALVHLYFNLIGTLVFLVAVYGGTALLGAPSFWNDPVGRTGIANFHTLFNVGVTLLLIPFAGLIERIARGSVKDEPETEQEKELALLDDRLLKSPAIALQQVDHVIGSMGELALQNYLDSVSLLVRYDPKMVEQVDRVESLIDRIEDRLENYMISLSSEELSQGESRSISTKLHLVKDYERIGDYSTNLTECAQELEQNRISFTQQALDEIDVLVRAVNEILEISNAACVSMDPVAARRIEPLEETIDAIVERLKDMHVERLKAGLCSVHAGIVFLEILTNLERIADHCSNIGLHIISSRQDAMRYESHEYIKRAHEATDAEYVRFFEEDMKRYYSVIEKSDQQGKSN